MNVLSKYLPDITDPPDTVWHYTNQTGLLGILENKTIRMTKIQYLNDSSEFSLALNLIINSLENINKQSTVVSNETLRGLKYFIENWKFKSVYIASFSKNRDALSQWRAYIGGEVGYSIGISVLHLSNLCLKKDGLFYRCIYDPREQKDIVNRFIENQLQNQVLKKAFANKPRLVKNINFDQLIGFIDEFMVIAPFLKDKGFEEEKEWRFVIRLNGNQTNKREVYRPGKSMLVPYIDESLKIGNETYSGINKIFVGPCPHPELSMESIKGAIRLYNPKRPNEDPMIEFPIEKSSIPYRNW